MNASVVGVAVLMLSAAAFADVVSWRDENGVRHFTNLADEVPSEYRDGVQVVVNERASQNTGSAPAAVPAAPAPRSSDAPTREAEAIYGQSEDLARAYAAGLRRGFEAARAAGGGGGGGGSVQVNGPLAIATTREDSGAYAPFPWYASGFLPPAWYPLVTTSFDGGRSRHLTLRLLLQDQFELDRAAPYVYVERLPPFGVLPLGPNLNVFMPRGLPPYSVPATSRVIVR
jgi:hypothetical protein